MRRKSTIYCAFVLLALWFDFSASSVVGSLKGNDGRHVLQTNEKREIVVSENNANMNKVVTRADVGDTLLLKAEKVTIKEPLTISVDELHIRGASAEKRTIIHCTAPGARIDVTSDKVVFENVEIRGCTGPAVRLRNGEAVYDPFAPKPKKPKKTRSLSIVFRGVRFVENKAAESDLNYHQLLEGGAMQITESTEALVEDCEFKDNVAFLGGAIRVDGGSLTVNRSRFSGNEAQTAGGAISGSVAVTGRKFSGSFAIANSVFYGNRDVQGGEDLPGLTLPYGSPLETSEFLSFPSPQLSGGAIHVQGFEEVLIADSLFDGNTANPAAGAIFISDNGAVMLRNNTLRNNVARFDQGPFRNVDLEQGGAIYVAFTDPESRIRLEKCTFRNNTATYGGGLHMVTTLVTTAYIDDCEFSDNSAILGGGGMVLRNIIEVEFMNTRFYRNRATAGGALLLTNGAGARFTQGIDSSRDTVFEENMALDGGACFFLGAGQVHTQKISFIRNKAERNGGGMCLVESLASGSVTLQQSFFLKNTARRGGGLFMDSIASLILRGPSPEYVVFRENKAMAGGAVYLRPSSQVKNIVSVTKMNCTDNMAVKRIEEIYESPVPYADSSIQTYGFGQARRLFQDPFQDRAEGGDELLRPTGEDPCHPGGGGAVCLVLSEVPERASVKVEIANSRFSDNEASTGGGMFIATKKGSTWSEQCDLGASTSKSLTDRPCRQLSVRDVLMYNNNAANAGGAMFASDAAQVHYSTEEDALGEFRYQRLSEMAANDRNPENKVGFGGYGNQYASNAVRLAIMSPSIVPAEDGRNVLVQDHESGTNLPEIKFKVVDAFKNTVSGGILDSTMKVTVSSDQGIVSGQLVATANAGIVVFDSLVVTAHPGNYSLTFDAEEDVVESYIVWLSIRRCNIGEHNITEGRICSLCQPGFYGFDPAIPCQACKNEANCTGGASQVPKNGYWHSTPFSTQFHECLVRRACSYNDRGKDLSEVLDSGIVPSTTVYSNGEYPQCNEGYKDVLCGSCDANYGSKPGGECVKCRGRFATYGIVSIVALWQLVLLGFTIRSALNSIRDMRDMRAIMAQNNCGNVESMPTTYQLKLVSTPSSSSLNGSCRKLSVNTNAMECQRSFKSVASEASMSMGGTPSSRNLTPTDHIVAAETVSETIKIAVNFLQVTSVAVSINVEWTETVKKMLETENSVAGFSNGSAFAPLTCLLEQSANRSVHGMILRVAFPVSLLIFVIFLFFLNWLRIRVTEQKGLEYIYSRSVICILVALFFSYDSLNRELMRIVNCVQLDEEDAEDETGYSRYAVARGQYWGEDTSFKCYEGTHLRLLTIMGIPGLTLFSFGIPAFILVFLLYIRERKRIYEQRFLNTYGFVYQNYTERFVYWEVSIMLRKACIGGIVVFAYPLGANLQGIMALGVLIVALVLHLVATPFKYRILNVLESFSLLVSIFTFYSGIVFNDSNTSYPAKVLLSGSLVLINSSLFVMFMARVLMDVDKFITAKLVLLGETELPKGFGGRSMKLAYVLLGKAKEQVQITFQTQANRFARTLTRGEKSMPSTTLSGIQEGDVELASTAADA